VRRFDTVLDTEAPSVDLAEARKEKIVICP
jgi:hypothetical protein